MVFFKPNIDWLSDHAWILICGATLTQHEGPRHFIDLDTYGGRRSTTCRACGRMQCSGNTQMFGSCSRPAIRCNSLAASTTLCRKNWPVRTKIFSTNNCCRVFTKTMKRSTRIRSISFCKQTESPCGRKRPFPRTSLRTRHRLSLAPAKIATRPHRAFRQRNSKRILRIATDMGHYIGDAHVPLHTTSNYNGQKTGQHGIHGFWESRVQNFADRRIRLFCG